MKEQDVAIINIEKIYENYKELFPSELEFLIIYNLYNNKSAMSEDFSYSEVKQTIIDTAKLPFITTGKSIQVERVFKNLLGNYIERLPGNTHKFVLTPHADRIVEIVTNRIKNPYLKFPLKETFETYFQLHPDTSKEIASLQRWFKLGFQNTAQQVVIGHLEGLKLSVSQAIKELNLILEADNLSATQMLQRFSTNFRVLGDNARQINEAIKMKVEVHYSLRDIVDNYIQEALLYKNPVTEEEQKHYAELKENRETAKKIKDEVYLFFEKVDKQLDLINMNLSFASFKVTELQESLRAQSRYKINLKKMLVFLLENSTSDNQGIILPYNFPQKQIVQEKFRFRALRYWDMGFLRRGKPMERARDDDYEKEERSLIESEFDKQQLIQDLFEKAKSTLLETNKLNLSEMLQEISENDSIEVAVQTGYEFIRNLSKETEIDIKKELKGNNLKTWKVIVQNKPSSNS